MPIKEFKCSEGHYSEAMVKHDVKDHICPECGNPSKQVFRTPPRIDWLRMGAQENVSPEFIDKFDKMHRKQKAKEEAFEKEHGEGEYYNRAPGS